MLEASSAERATARGELRKASRSIVPEFVGVCNTTEGMPPSAAEEEEGSEELRVSGSGCEDVVEMADDDDDDVEAGAAMCRGALVAPTAEDDVGIIEGPIIEPRPLRRNATFEPELRSKSLDPPVRGGFAYTYVTDLGRWYGW